MLGWGVFYVALRLGNYGIMTSVYCAFVLSDTDLVRLFQIILEYECLSRWLGLSLALIIECVGVIVWIWFISAISYTSAY